MKKLLALLLIFTLIFTMSTSVFAATDTSNNAKAVTKADIEKLVEKYGGRILTDKEIKELGLDKSKFKEMEKSIDLAEFEKLLIARKAEWKDVTYTDNTALLKEISPSLAAPSLQSLTYGTETQTITTTLYTSGGPFYSTGLTVRYQVPVTYTQDVTTLPGEPQQITNKNIINYTQGEVIQTSGYPYHRVTSYYSGVTKYSNTILHHTGGFTSDNYIGVDVNGYEVLFFAGTSSIYFDHYHSL